MKKQLLFKTLLAVALLMLGANSWGAVTLLDVKTAVDASADPLDFVLGDNSSTSNFYVTIKSESKSSFAGGNYNYARTSDATEYFSTTQVWKIGGGMDGSSRSMKFNIPSAGTLYVYARTGKSGDTRSITVNSQTVEFDPPTITISSKTCYVGRAITFEAAGEYATTATASINFSAFEFVPAAPAAPGAVSFSPAAGSVAAGTSITLTSSGATTIVYQWGASAVDGEGDWSTVETYSDSNKPVVPAAGSTNTVLSVKATNANGSTYGSASYTPVKMALKTIYSFADGIGSQEVTAATASVETSPMSLGNTSGRIKLTAATGFEFKNGDAIEFSGTIGNTSKKYGIYYGPTTSLGKDLYVAAGLPCHVSGTLTLDAATSDLYIGRYDGTTTSFATFTVRRQTEATSEAFTGAVKINGSAATEDVDYTKEGNVYTLTAEYSTMPNVCLVNHIVFADASEEDQNVLVAFGNPDGTYFTGTAVIDGTTYTVKAPCGQINALKVVYKDGGTTVKEENLDVTGLKIGASYTVPFRMYVEKDGALYQTTKNGSSPWYGDAVTLEYNTTVTKSVSSVDLGGGTLELFEDFDGATSDYANDRASNCSAYNNTAYTSESNLPAGKYTFIVKALNKNRGSSVKVGETTVFTIGDVNSTVGTWTDKTFTDVIVPADGKLSLVKGGNNTIDYYDILIAIRTGDATVSKSISSAGWATYCSPYALDFSGDITNLTDAYIVTGGTGGVLAKTSVKGGTVPANTGLLLNGDEGTVTIPVVGSSSTNVSANKLVGVTADTPIAAEAGYVLMGSPSLGFYLNSNAFTVGANTAYLPANFDTTGARFFSLFDDATGINAINGEGSMVNGSVFNLAGQRVAQPTKGLYIVNGKKVVIK